MPILTDLDEQLAHQIPEPFSNVAVHHEHWRESYFFVAHPRSTPGDVLILTMASYPQHQKLNCYQMGRVDGRQIFALHERPYAGDPHTTRVGPVHVEIVQPYQRVELSVDASAPEVPVGLDLTFTARTAAYALRRGTMKAGSELIWDQSHMFQSGRFDGSYTFEGHRYEVDDWWGQRDHSWGLRDHARVPLWMWLAIQLPDAMIGVWHWEYANGARVYTDGCFAPTGGRRPVPVIDFRHSLHWTDKEGRPVSYDRDGGDVRGLAGGVDFVFEGGSKLHVEAKGSWCAPYGRLGGGQHQMVVETDDGRRGTAIYEITGAHHHHFFPVPRAEKLPPG
jgi:hypothetical protein